MPPSARTPYGRLVKAWCLGRLHRHARGRGMGRGLEQSPVLLAAATRRADHSGVRSRARAFERRGSGPDAGTEGQRDSERSTKGGLGVVLLRHVWRKKEAFDAGGERRTDGQGKQPKSNCRLRAGAEPIHQAGMVATVGDGRQCHHGSGAGVSACTTRLAVCAMLQRSSPPLLPGYCSRDPRLRDATMTAAADQPARV